jgi:hypothetical protein
MNGFSYLVIGLDYKPGVQTLGDNCGRPRCPMAVPAIPKKELQQQYAEFGFERIQPSKEDVDQWHPKAIGGMEFPSDELARLWLNSTADGKEFKDTFKYLFVARVRA